MKTLIDKHLSTFALVVIYITTVILHIFIDSFILEFQVTLLLTMIPFVLLGIVIDYLINGKSELKHSYGITAKLSPSGIFILIFLSFLYELSGREMSDLFQYVIWLFIALPFMISSYESEGHSKRLIYSIIGVGLVLFTYLHLTTLTEELTDGIGLWFYLFSLFMMLYSASTIRLAPYISTIIGILCATALLYVRYLPVTAQGQLYGWDYDIAYLFELILMGAFILSILVRLLSNYMNRKVILKQE